MPDQVLPNRAAKSQHETSGAELLTDAKSLSDEDKSRLIRETLAACPELTSETAEMAAVLDREPAAAQQTLTYLAKRKPGPKTEDRDKIVAGAQVGPYHLIKELGEGGMGAVFLAEQREPVKRQVALKFLKIDEASPGSADLLASEMQALALMNHSNIAKVYDTGFTQSGMPYFAMELVTGQVMNAYCDDHRLSIRERLRLFVRVCSGISHAHQRGIIHRDIKPDNILISTEEKEPKIIDFGVAKAAKPGSAALIEDDDGAVVGTPAYISPEQITKPQEVDTRTDVYALGILLYELLVGALPYMMKTPSMVALLVKVVQGKHPDMAIRFGDLGASRDAIAVKRRSTPKRLSKTLKGDLNWIVKKAIARDKDDRYDSVAHLSADIQRWLRHQAVDAHPPTTSYYLRKFLRRYWLAATAMSISSTSLIVGLALALVGYVQAVRSKEAVALEAEKSQAINAFLTEMLESVDPETQGGAVEVVDILDSASRDMHRKIGDQVEVEANLRETLGNTYNQLGKYDEASREIDRTVDLYGRMFGETHPKTLNAMRLRARILKNRGAYEKAESILAEILARQAETQEPDAEDVIQTQVQLAIVKSFLGKTDRAKAILTSLQTSLEATREKSDATYLTVRNNLAQLIEKEGKLDEAAVIYQELLDIRRASLGETHPTTLTTMNNLASVYTKQRRLDEAEELHRLTLERRKEVLGPTHPATLVSMSNLAKVSLYRRDFSRGEELLRQVLALRSESMGEEHPKTLDTRATLVTALWGQGKLTQAETICRELIDIEAKIHGKTHPNTLRSRTNLGFIVSNQNRPKDALAIHQSVLEDAKTQYDADHWRIAQFQGNVGTCLAQLGRFAEAEPFLVARFERYRAVFGDTHRNTQQAVQHLVRLYRQWNRNDLADQYSQFAEQSP